MLQLLSGTLLPQNLWGELALAARCLANPALLPSG